MQKISIIGNIGNDAVVKSSGNSQFVTFNVAVTSRRKNGENVHENTNWYDCSFDNVKLAEYLKKGTKVYLEGGFKLDQFYSEKTQKWVPKLNVFVNSLELLSAKKEDNVQPQPPAAPGAIEQVFSPDKSDLPF